MSNKVHHKSIDIPFVLIVMSDTSKDQEVSDCSKALVHGSSKVETWEACGSRKLSPTKSSIIVRPASIDSLWSDY